MSDAPTPAETDCPEIAAGAVPGSRTTDRYPFVAVSGKDTVCGHINCPLPISRVYTRIGGYLLLVHATGYSVVKLLFSYFLLKVTLFSRLDRCFGSRGVAAVTEQGTPQERRYIEFFLGFQVLKQ